MKKYLPWDKEIPGLWWTSRQERHEDQLAAQKQIIHYRFNRGRYPKENARLDRLYDGDERFRHPTDYEVFKEGLLRDAVPRFIEKEKRTGNTVNPVDAGICRLCMVLKRMGKQYPDRDGVPKDYKPAYFDNRLYRKKKKGAVAP